MGVTIKYIFFIIIIVILFFSFIVIVVIRAFRTAVVPELRVQY